MVLRWSHYGLGGAGTTPRQTTGESHERTGQAPPAAAAEFAFHRAFNRATGRIKLAWFLLHVARYLPGQIYASDAAWGAAAVAGHRELIAALRRHDVDTVVRLTSGEVSDAAQRLVARLDEIG